MKSISFNRSDLFYGLKLGAIAVLYFYAGKLGLSLAFINTSASAVWPPTGIALTAYLLLGYRVWPAIFLGAFFVNWTTAGGVLASSSIALGNTLEGFVGAWLVNKFCNGRGAFDQTNYTFKYVIFAALFSTVISAGIGVTTLCLGRLAVWSQYGPIWLTWWLGDVASNIVVAPFLIIWSQKFISRLSFRRAAEFALMLGMTFLVNQIVFGGWFLRSEDLSPGFLCVPFLLWAAFRFGARGASLSAFMMSVIAVWGTAHGHGRFAFEEANLSLLLLQAYVGTITATMLILGVAVDQNRRDEKTFKLVVEASPIGMVMIDQSGKILLVNSQVEKLFGYRREELTGKPVELLVPSRFRGQHPRYRSEYFAKPSLRAMGAGRDLYGVRKDGSEFPVEIGLNPIKTAQGVLVMASIADITERKSAEENRTRLAAIVRSSQDAIIGKTLEGIITSWNEGAERLYGYSAEEIIGRPITQLVPPDRPDEITWILQQLSRGEHIDRFETVRVRKDQKQVHVSVTISAIKNASGKVVGASSIARDITEQKLAAQALIISNKRLGELVALKDEFVASVSHELRTPLTAIKEGISLISDRVVGPLNEEQEDFLKTVGQSVDRLTELIGNLLDISKIEAGKFRLSRRRVNFKQTVETLLNNYKAISSRRTIRTAVENVPDVFADPDRLLQIMTNLFSNALKFTGDNGTIIISAAKQDGFVIVSVEDDGIGIANEDLPKLFKKFSQLGTKHAQGTGLGLALVKQLIEMHQGSIFVASKPGKGSRFSFSLPVYVPHISDDLQHQDDPSVMKRGGMHG